jgi:hypothetical protein
MSRIANRRLFWTPSTAPDAVATEIYAGRVADHASVQAFLEAIEAGNLPAHAEVPQGTGEYYLADLEEDVWHFAIATRDDDGNHSDAVQHPDWIGVPLDVSPPEAPVPGGLDSGS